MKIYIDQSGKVEDTSLDTVVAYSNGDVVAIVIKASEKRKIQQFFRLAGKPKMFVYRTFAALLFFLLEGKFRKPGKFIIDREYWGKENTIKDQLLRIIRANYHSNFDPEKISFGLVGKTRDCHKQAVLVLRKKVKADKIVKSEDILKLVL